MELGCRGVQQRMRRAAVDSPDLGWVGGVEEQVVKVRVEGRRFYS